MKKIYQITKTKLALVALLTIAASCSKDKAGNTVDANQGGLKLSLTEAEFTSNDLVTKASTKSSTNKPLSITQEIQSGPFSITAELTENTSSNVALKASSGNKAATSLALRGTVQYRVVAYETDGTYVDQAVGNAADASQVFFGDKLIAGNKYTFVVYSVGSTTVAPPAAPTTNLYAAGALFFDFSTYEQDGGDLMYAISKDVTILGNNTPTPLAAPLQHLFTRVNILVDNSDATGTFGTANYVKGGYLSEVPVQAQWLSSFQDVEIDLSTGATVSSVADNSVAAISDLNATARTFIVNQLQNPNFSVSLRIPSTQIKIGHDINAQNVDFNFSNAGLGLKPGYSYTLKLRFNSDRYVNPNNVTRTATAADARYAVIGGHRWDRYNLGVTGGVSPATNNPDAIPSNQGLYGNYYQWGIQTPAANAYSGDAAIAGWNTTPAPDGAWNSGTATAPIKTAADPCGANDRVPTQAEFARLGAYTRHTSIGNWTGFQTTGAGLSDFTAAHIMTSRKSSDIKLSFPAAAHRETISGAQRARQGSAIYWSNTAVGGNDRAFQGRGFVSSFDTSNYFKTAAYPVRCIQNKS
ncbi:hypothetical protein [Sphingobacterium sp.]|uniref:hypothetical protein n=1 Tax=Sphingobacterium sp. TaxID=341027 RepID=UPI0028A2B91C|nr:hypothetical protein [Sphingobacterium sp.]